ncbi:hypothetical protein C8C85_1985 [Flavobacterium sp. 103]|uniref:hypothetical protein n=1 Tax=Flavobacterium sp. 103 TaxID=2135624 RepID=UPI000D5C5505|nr:hypothetical protein [Flavobacterium sp. 103]PVX46159.1 hypothetical protein C8C85_1985 [Flavobacterium sp. 103]
MENENKYIWSNLKNGTYSKLASDIPTVEYNTIPFRNIVISDNVFILNFHKSYKKVIIPKKIESLFISLLDKYELSKFLEEFIILSCASQKSFIDNIGTKAELKRDVLLQDFNNMKKDYAEFLNVIGIYLSSESKNKTNTISFKPDAAPTVSINNFFVLNDIYDTICKGLDITKENFLERKEELLDLKNNISVRHYSEVVKTSIVVNLYEFALKSSKRRSDSLRFVGCFLHISQIPTNSEEIDKKIDIDLFNDIDLFLKSIEIKNLAHYINIKRQKRFRL